MSERMKSIVTIAGPLLVLFTALLDPRWSATLAFSTLIIVGISVILETRRRIGSTRSKSRHELKRTLLQQRQHEGTQ